MWEYLLLSWNKSVREKESEAASRAKAEVCQGKVRGAKVWAKAVSTRSFYNMLINLLLMK